MTLKNLKRKGFIYLNHINQNQHPTISLLILLTSKKGELVKVQ